MSSRAASPMTEAPAPPMPPPGTLTEFAACEALKN